MTLELLTPICKQEMQKAAPKFVGEHDFRNFCKMDAANVVDSLLDITKTPRKPQYKMAAELPLILRSCLFGKADFMCSAGLSCRTFGANFQKYFFSFFFLTRYLTITASKLYHLIA